LDGTTDMADKTHTYRILVFEEIYNEYLVTLDEELDPDKYDFDYLCIEAVDGETPVDTDHWSTEIRRVTEVSESGTTMAVLHDEG
jgi:hypothetical protein